MRSWEMSEKPKKPSWLDAPEYSVSDWFEDMKEWRKSVEEVQRKVKREMERMNEPLWTKFDEVCWWVMYLTICAFAGYVLGAAIVKVWGL
jgi:hypothetical protein